MCVYPDLCTKETCYTIYCWLLVFCLNSNNASQIYTVHSFFCLNSLSWTVWFYIKIRRCAFWPAAHNKSVNSIERKLMKVHFSKVQLPPSKCSKWRNVRLNSCLTVTTWRQGQRSESAPFTGTCSVPQKRRDVTLCFDRLKWTSIWVPMSDCFVFAYLIPSKVTWVKVTCFYPPLQTCFCCCLQLHGQNLLYLCVTIDLNWSCLLWLMLQEMSPQMLCAKGHKVFRSQASDLVQFQKC